MANPSIGLVAAGTMVGGDSEAIDRCAAVFEIIGGNVAHLGPPAAGQLGKAINQMAMGVAEASFLEAMLVGLKGGRAPQQVWKVLSTAGATKTSFERAAKAVNEGNAEHHDCKIGEVPYFMEEAVAQGYSLPLTEAFNAFCENVEKSIKDPLHIPTASFWKELMSRGQ